MDCNNVCQGIQQFIGNITLNLVWAAVIIGGIVLVFKLFSAATRNVSREVRGTYADIRNSPLGRLMGKRTHLLYLVPLSAVGLWEAFKSPLVLEYWWFEPLTFWAGVLFGGIAVANILTGFPSREESKPRLPPRPDREG